MGIVIAMPTIFYTFIRILQFVNSKKPNIFAEDLKVQPMNTLPSVIDSYASTVAASLLQQTLNVGGEHVHI
jgi:hypothetical protein